MYALGNRTYTQLESTNKSIFLSNYLSKTRGLVSGWFCINCTVMKIVKRKIWLHCGAEVMVLEQCVTNQTWTSLVEYEGFYRTNCYASVSMTSSKIIIQHKNGNIPYALQLGQS